MARSNVQIVKDFYGAFARGDTLAALAELAAEIVWLEAENYPYADGNPYLTPAAVTAGVLNRVPLEWKDFKVHVTDVFEASGNRIIATGRYQGTYISTNKSIDAQMAHIWTLRDGKIVGFQQFADTLQVVFATKQSA